MRRAPPAHKQRSITTLGEYIEQKSDKPDPKKLTFEEWWATQRGILYIGDSTSHAMKPFSKKIWDAAQANK